MDYPGLIKLLAPECIVVLTALAVLFADLKFWRGLPNGRRLGRGVALATVGLGAAALFAGLGEKSADLLVGMLVLTPVAQFLKLVLLVLTIATVWLCADTDFTDHVGEFLALLLLAATGMMLLVSTENLLMIFVSLELVSLSLYVMTAFNKRSPRSAEAALKYFLFGGMAAGFTLFGFSLLYGLSGSIHLPDIASALRTKGSDPLAMVAIVMVLAGFGFKIAAVPFHFWAPDAYEGAPGPAAAFIASGSKIASFFILAKLLQAGMPGAAGSGAWKAFVPGWMPVVAILAIASMIFGNFAALAQSSLRRLLACSAIAHAGYALLALLANSPDTGSALLYYVITYAMTLVGLFGLVMAVERGNGNGDDSMSRLAGLSQRSPLLAGCLSVFGLSLAGVPPLAGFFGKFYVFVAVTKSGPSLSSFWLVLVAITMSCVSLYYYLQVLKQAWVAKPADENAPAQAGRPLVLVVSLLALGVVLLGCAPELLLVYLR